MTKTKNPGQRNATEAMLRHCRVASQKEAAASLAARKRHIQASVKRFLEAEDRKEREARNRKILRRHESQQLAQQVREAETLDGYLGRLRREQRQAADASVPSAAVLAERWASATQTREAEEKAAVKREQEATAAKATSVIDAPSVQELHLRWLRTQR